MSSSLKPMMQNSGPQAAMLGDGSRLHLNHGPIDLVIEAIGSEPGKRRAYEQARDAFETVLDSLVAELPLLRSPVGERPEGFVAIRMWEAARPYGNEFITPMVAVAGSVADHILAAMTEGAELDRAYVNNGGDIALTVNEGRFTISICDNPVTGQSGGTVSIEPADGIGGIATSGWRGRSFSFGIADAVTVLATSAAKADAGATMIANKIDLPGSPKIGREMANVLQPDSDLGSRMVTTSVDQLDENEIQMALAAGRLAALDYLQAGRINAAYLAVADIRLTVPDTQINAITSGSRTDG